MQLRRNVFPVRWELNFYILFSLNSVFEVMSWLSRRSVIPEARVLSRDSVFEYCGGQSGTEAGVPSSPYCFPYQYHSTNAPYVSPSWYYFYSKDKRDKFRDHQTKYYSFVYRAAIGRQVLPRFFRPYKLHLPVWILNCLQKKKIVP